MAMSACGLFPALWVSPVTGTVFCGWVHPVTGQVSPGWYSAAHNVVLPAWVSPHGAHFPGVLTRHSDRDVVEPGWLLPPTQGGGGGGDADAVVVLRGWYDAASGTVYPGHCRRGGGDGGQAEVVVKGFYCPRRCAVVPFRYYAAAPGSFPPRVRRALLGAHGAGVSRLERETGCSVSFKPLEDGTANYRCVVVADSLKAARRGARYVEDAAAAAAAAVAAAEAAEAAVAAVAAGAVAGNAGKAPALAPAAAAAAPAAARAGASSADNGASSGCRAAAGADDGSQRSGAMPVKAPASRRWRQQQPARARSWGQQKGAAGSA